MKPPIEGTAGTIWRTATAPARVLAPGFSMFARIAKANFWIETEREHLGAGPDIDMLDEPNIQRPRDGAGPLNHRRYRVHISGSRLTAQELVKTFKTEPNRFSPTSFATFDPPPGPAGMVVGDELTVRLPGPWDGPVMVAESEPHCVRLETREGHMEAGWINFSASEEESRLLFEIESVARSGDPVFDLLYHPGKVAKLVQTEMWVRVLEAAVSMSGGRLCGRPIVETTVYQGAQR